MQWPLPYPRIATLHRWEEDPVEGIPNPTLHHMNKGKKEGEVDEISTEAKMTNIPPYARRIRSSQISYSTKYHGMQILQPVDRKTNPRISYILISMIVWQLFLEYHLIPVGIRQPNATK